MALGRGNIQIDVGARGLTEDIVKQVRTAEKKIRPLSVSLDEKGFRQPLGRITGDLAEFQKSLDASVARTLAFGAAVGVLNTVTQGFKAMIQSAAEVEKKLTDINVILNLNANSLEDFSSKLFQAAKNTGQSFETVSDAAVELSRQGLGAEETLKRINDAMILTRLSGMDAAKSVETLTAAINSFGDTALTTTELVNKLATVDAAFAVSTEDLANALARAGSTAQSAKVDLNELLAAVTSVQQTTARGGSVIGNAFKSIFTRIQRSGVREALEEIGVATTDSFGNIRGALNILKDYAGVYSTLSDSQRAYTDELIAGVFQINNLKALVKDLGSDYSIYERALNQSNNATDEAVRRNEKLQGTLSALINEASVNAKELAATLGDLVATPAVENLLKIFNSISGALADALDPEKGNKLIQNMFKSIGNFIAGPGLILIGVAFVKLFKFITGQSVKAVQEIFKIGSATNKIAEAEAKIGFLLKNNKTLYEAISNEALSHEQKEELVLQTIKAQNKAYAQQQAMISRLAGSRAVGGALRNRAGGYIPNFTKKVEGAINSERSAIAAGEGGASRSAKPKVLNNFPIGGGRRETIVANTDEVIVPKFGGSSGSAIFNQDMIRSAGGVPKGAVPVARGFIPNFASSLQKNKEFSKFLNSKDGLSIDVERDLGGFGLVSAAGARGRQSATLKRMSGFSPSKNNQIIDKISGSKLTQEDKKYISGVIERKRTRFENIGTSSIMEMESATARNTIQGKAGAINELIQPFMADAVANVSSRIYNSILGNEVGSSLVGNVRRQANVDSTIVSPSVEGGIFESALRLGSAESAKSLGKDSSSAIWDFEETGNITNDMRDIFFSGYNIQKGDAKRVGGSTSINETVEKSHKDFFDKSLEAIYTQHWSPFFEMGNKLTEGSRKKPRAKKGLAKAGGFIPNYIFARPQESAGLKKFQPSDKEFQPRDVLTIGKQGSEARKAFVRDVSSGQLLKHLRSNLRDNKYVNIIKKGFIKDQTEIGKAYPKITAQTLGKQKEQEFGIVGKTPAYIYSRKRNIRSWSSQIEDFGDETSRSKIHPKLKQYIKSPYYNFDSVSIKKPETSATNIDYDEFKNRLDRSLDEKNLNLKKLFDTGIDMFPKSPSQIDDDWRGRYNKIINNPKNKKFFENQLKSYNEAKRNKKNIGFSSGRIFEELINSGLAAVKEELGYLSTLDNANWDLDVITKKERDVLNLKSAGFGDIKTTLGEGESLKESFIKKFIRQPFGGNASGGFIPNFANSLEEAVVREKQALSDQGSGAQVYVDQDNRLKGSKNPMGLLVANTRDEPLSGSQGVDRALATGMNPKNHGKGMSGGYVPNYILPALAGISKLGGLLKLGKNVTSLGKQATKTSGEIAKQSKATKNLGGSLLNTFLGIEIFVTPILQTLGVEFEGVSQTIANVVSSTARATGSFFGMNVANQELIESNEKYQESVEKQINIISQNIEKVDKFAQTLAILGTASEKGDVGAIGKTVQNLLDQAGDLQNIDPDAFKDLLSSIGDSEKLKESTQNLKDLIEQGKNLKTFGSDFAELVNKLEGKDTFKDAEISGQDIKNITSQLTGNLSPEKFKQLNDELKGFNVDSGNSINKIISLQSVLGDFDATLISNISQSKDLTQEVLRSLKAQAAYKEASKQLTAALTKNLLPITNLNKQFDQLANAITASANAIDKSYKTLSEISEIQSGSRLEQLKGAGTATSTDLLRGQAAADIAKVTKDGQQKIQSLLRSFTQTTLKESEKGSVLEGTLQKIVDSLANGGSTEDAIKLLLEVQKNGNAKQKEAAQKTIEAIRGASQDQVAASKIIQARLEAQLQSERIQAVNFQRNNQLSESQLKLFSDFSDLSKAQATEARSTLEEIRDLNQVISTVESLGGNKDILAELKESNRNLSQLENFRQAFTSLGSAAGVTFDAQSLGELENQVDKFIQSDSFGKLDAEARRLVIALTDGVDKARELEKEGGVKTAKDVEQAAETKITDASIGSLANQFEQVLSGPLAEALKIGPEVASVLNKPIGDISEIAKNIQKISSDNAENTKENTEIQKQNADQIAAAVAAMQEALSGSEGISGAADKMEKAAGIMEEAAKKISGGGAASGFVPSFSPMGEQVARAVKTERALGGKPVVDYNKQVGTYVRDGNTQPNFAAVKRDHPEGLRKATKNSKILQGISKANGFVPNFKDFYRHEKEIDTGGSAEALDINAALRSGKTKTSVKKYDFEDIINFAYFGSPFSKVKPFVDQAALSSVMKRFSAGGFSDLFIEKALPLGEDYKKWEPAHENIIKETINRGKGDLSDLLFRRVPEFKKWIIGNKFRSTDNIGGVDFKKAFPVFENMFNRGYFSKKLTSGNFINSKTRAYEGLEYYREPNFNLEKIANSAIKSGELRKGVLTGFQDELHARHPLNAEEFNKIALSLSGKSLKNAILNPLAADTGFLSSVSGFSEFIKNSFFNRNLKSAIQSEEVFKLPLSIRPEPNPSGRTSLVSSVEPSTWSRDGITEVIDTLSQIMSQNDKTIGKQKVFQTLEKTLTKETLEQQGANFNPILLKEAEQENVHYKDLLQKLTSYKQWHDSAKNEKGFLSHVSSNGEIVGPDGGDFSLTPKTDINKEVSIQGYTPKDKAINFVSQALNGVLSTKAQSVNKNLIENYFPKNLEDASINMLSKDKTFESIENAKEIFSQRKSQLKKKIKTKKAARQDVAGLEAQLENVKAQEVQLTDAKKAAEQKIQGAEGLIKTKVQEEAAVQQTDLQKERNLLYLGLLGKQAEEKRGSLAAFQFQERVDRVKDVIGKYPTYIDTLLKPRERRKAEAEKLSKKFAGTPRADKFAKIAEKNTNIINFLKDRKSLYESGEAGIAHLYNVNDDTKLSRIDGEIVGKSIWEPSRPDYLDVFKKLKERYAIDPTAAETNLQGKGIESRDLLEKYSNYKNDQLVNLFAQIQEQAGNSPTEFSKTFANLGGNERLDLMAKLGARPEDPNEVKNLLENPNILELGKRIIALSQNALTPEMGFLFREILNPNADKVARETIFEKIKQMGIPFMSTKPISEFLMNSKIGIAPKGGAMKQINALDSDSIAMAINFMRESQIQSYINENRQKLEAEGLADSPRIIDLIRGKKDNLLESPLYAQYRSIQEPNFLQEFIKTKLQNGKVSNIDSWNKKYQVKEYINNISAKKITDGYDGFYGKFEPSELYSSNKPIQDVNGDNPFAVFGGQRVSPLEAAKKVMGFELKHGINEDFEKFLSNETHPFPELNVPTAGRIEAFRNKVYETSKGIKQKYAPAGYGKEHQAESPSGLFDKIEVLYSILNKNKEDGAAKGFVPNFSAIAGEIAASKMAGYKSPVSSSQVKTMNIPGVGKTAYNTQESVFKMPGMSQPFIAPPSNSKAATGYRKAVEKKFNFNPYGKTAADGFVPNFANGGSELKSVVSGLENFVRSFGDNVANLGQALSSLNFEQLTSASQQMIDSASEFSRQSSTIKEAADIFKQGANGISQAKTETTNSGNIDQSASLIQQSVDGLSKELQKNIEVDASTITEPINSLTNALSTVRGEIDIKVPNINVSVNGASAVSSSIKTILEQQIPQIVQQTIAQEEQKLINKIKDAIF